MIARILSGLVGAVMLISAIGWIIDPAAAAAGLEIKESLKDVGGETLLGKNTLTISRKFNIKNYMDFQQVKNSHLLRFHLIQHEI